MMSFEETLWRIAVNYSTTDREVRKEMTSAILAAKDNPGFQKLFGERVIPSPEMFIQTIARLLSDTNSMAS